MKSWQLLCVVLAVVAVAAAFILSIGGKTEIGKKLDDLKQCKTIGEVKELFENDKGKLEIIGDSVRKKIGSFNPSESEIEAVKKWLPATVSLNLVVVPDLSKRIVDTTNNREQVKRDVRLMKHIFEAFKKKTASKMKSKDRLIVAVTDEEQADGLFGGLADSMIVDLSKNTEKVNWLYFEKEGIESRYGKYVDSLYALAYKKPLGADYVKFFESRLEGYILPPTLFDDYRNALIIITDGYLEAEHTLYTGNRDVRKGIANRIRKGQPFEEMMFNVIKLPDIGQEFPMWEVLVMEVHERTKASPQEPLDAGTPEDYKILKTWWQGWFTLMKINIDEKKFFVRRYDDMSRTEAEIDRFLNK